MIVDISSYLGFWPYWGNPYAEETGEKLIKLMDQNHIDKALVVSTKSIFYNPVEGNELVFQVAERYRGRIIPTISISIMQQEDPSSYLEECLDRGAKAVRLYPYYHGYKLRPDNKALAKLVNSATAMNCPIIIPLRLLMNWGFYTLSIQEVITFVKEFPTTRFVIGGFNYGEFYELLNLAKTVEGVYLDTTCLTMMDGIKRLTAEVPKRKILCGTGSPLQNPACGLIKISEADINEEMKELILGVNAVELFKL
ncbi:amidohydrolase family protein [Neomoorella humiferrea]|uniref:amidohydrolase family protein n=1 Tax=Neomoorella humiferrea TaxID=676965 RepID=UPI003D8E794E